jgi:alkylation response protein AidB-like acyl-CoA dehydrogenase
MAAPHAARRARARGDSMFQFTPEQEMVRRAVRQWAERELAPEVDALERGELLPYDLMRSLGAALGIGELARARFARLARGGDDAAAAREEREGGGAGLVHIVALELSRVCPGFVLSFGASTGLAGGAIMARGTREQKLRFGLPLLTLEKIGAWGMTEPGAGSDAFGGMRTVARPDGDHFVLSGEKTFITNAPHADVFVVYAKLDRGDDPASRPMQAFLLERGAPGLETSQPMEKMGMRASPTGQIFLRDVRVPRDQLLGGSEREQTRSGARDVFHGERTGMLPMALGIIERCLEDSLRYARERVQFGRPIGEYQLVQDKLARMYVARENVRNLFFKLLHREQHGPRITLAEACACKLYGARMATDVALEAVQLMGGNGYMSEYAVERLARDAKLLQIGGGTDEIQIVTIARALLRDGLPD